MRLVRSLVNVVLVLVVTFVFCMRAFGSRLLDPSGDAVITLARRWALWTTRMLGIRVDAALRGALRTDRPYVFMANHTSAADIWALYVALPVPVRMLAKKQLGVVPFLGWAMRAGRFIFIDRANPQASRRSIDEAAQRIASGDSVLLFPEGTRSRTGALGAFKKGGFHLAICAGAEIVPVAVEGAGAVLPVDSYFPRPGRIQVTIGSPISTQGMDDADRGVLLERVRHEIEHLLAESTPMRSAPVASTERAPA